MSSRRRTYLNSLLSEMKYIGKFINKSTNIGVNTLVPAYELNECSGVILIFYTSDYVKFGNGDYCIVDAILDGGEVSYRVDRNESPNNRLVFGRDNFRSYTNIFKFSKSTGLTCESYTSVESGDSYTTTTINYLQVIGI